MGRAGSICWTHHWVRVARLQNEVGTKYRLRRGTNFLPKNARTFAPKFLSLYLVDPKKCRKVPAIFAANHFPPKKNLKNSPTSFHRSAGRTLVRNPQMWERAHVGFGGTGRKRNGPCTKQRAWRKHGSSDTRLAEECPSKLRNTVIC